MKFRVPKPFAELHAAGRFDYFGAPYATLSQDERVKRAAERRRSVLYFDEIEWDRPLEEIEREPEAAHTRPGLVSFAGDGTGDRWSWYLPWQGDAAEPPVLHCPHVAKTATYFAPDFGSALERFWLRQGAGTEKLDAKAKGDLAAWLDIISPYLARGRRKKLDALLAKASPAAFEKEDAARGKRFARGHRPLDGPNLRVTEYDLEFLGEDALALYDESIAYYEALIQEGHARFKKQLAEAKKNRAAAVKALRGA